MPIIGNTIRLFAEFSTFSGVLSDPVNIVLEIYDTDQTYTFSGSQITKQSVGIYYCDFTIPNGQGWLNYKWSALLEDEAIVNKGKIEREWF